MGLLEDPYVQASLREGVPGQPAAPLPSPGPPAVRPEDVTAEDVRLLSDSHYIYL